MSDSEGTGRRVYRIPEVRERTLFDSIAENIVPEIFKFAEYCAVAGFILYVAIKTSSVPVFIFGAVLYACVYWYVLHKFTGLIKALEFRSLWAMRVTGIALLVVCTLIISGVLLVVLQIASAQANA